MQTPKTSAVKPTPNARRRAAAKPEPARAPVSLLPASAPPINEHSGDPNFMASLARGLRVIRAYHRVFYQFPVDFKSHV